MRHSIAWPRIVIGCGRMSGSFRAGRNHDLRFDEIDSSDCFRDGMFHLDAGVHFDEVQIALFIHQKLDGPALV